MKTPTRLLPLAALITGIAGSPLISEGVYYNIDQYGVFYAVELATGKTLYCIGTR